MGGVILIVALLGLAPLEATIDRWVDAEGVISFTHTPTALEWSPAGLFLAIGVLLVLGSLLSALVALWRQNQQWRAITVLNLCLGWTFVGWVVALVWVFVQPTEDSAMMDWLASVPSLLLQLARGMAIGGLIMGPFVVITRWAQRREQRRWAVREQMMTMRQQIREESMSEEWRHWHRQWRQQQAEIAREARRLGLPEEERDA
jgi:Superinfection immunity protein